MTVCQRHYHELSRDELPPEKVDPIELIRASLLEIKYVPCQKELINMQIDIDNKVSALKKLIEQVDPSLSAFNVQLRVRIYDSHDSILYNIANYKMKAIQYEKNDLISKAFKEKCLTNADSFIKRLTENMDKFTAAINQQKA